MVEEKTSGWFCPHCDQYVAQGAEHTCIGVLNEALKRLEERVAMLEYPRKKREIPLSPRERTTLKLIAEGKQNKEIADELGLSPQTVKNFCARIFQKLGVTNRTQAALRWRDMIEAQRNAN